MLHHLDLIRQATFMEPLVHVVFPPHDRRNCRNSIRCYTCRRWGHVAASCHFLSHTNPLFWRAKITQSGNTQSDAVGTLNLFPSEASHTNGQQQHLIKILFSVTQGQFFVTLQGYLIQHLWQVGPHRTVRLCLRLSPICIGYSLER